MGRKRQNAFLRLAGRRRKKESGLPSVQPLIIQSFAPEHRPAAAPYSVIVFQLPSGNIREKTPGDSPDL